MSAFYLTRPETWILSTLLHLPVQPGSILSDWLNTGKLDPGTTAEEGMRSLTGKGYCFPENAEQPIPPAFLTTLTLAAVNAAEITAIIRRGGQSNMTRFGQVGEGLVQFGMDEENLTLQPVELVEEAAGTILPDWFIVKQNEGQRAELPLGAFLLFKQACEFADIASVDSGFTSEAFKKSRLLDKFKLNSSWLNIFNAEGVRGVLSVEQMPLLDYYNQLVSRCYLEETASDNLVIGQDGQPLAEVFADPDMCSLTLSLRIWEGGFPITGVFLHGNDRLFLVEAKPGLLFVQQLESLQAGQSWVKALLDKGSRARYATYTIPPVPVVKPVAPVARPAVPASEGLLDQATMLRQAAWSLTFQSGPRQGQNIPLGDKMIIGRAAECDLHIADPLLSRRHAAIEKAGEAFVITDLGSGNGTFVNGSRINAPTTLKVGDRLEIGDSKINVVGPGMPVPPVAAPKPQVKPAPVPIPPISSQPRSQPPAVPQVKQPVSQPRPVQPQASPPVQPVSTPRPPAQPAPTPRPAAAAPAAAKCPHCGADLKPGVKFCRNCGKPLTQAPVAPTPPPQAAVCPNCGAAVKPGVKFCGTCGHKI